MRTAFAVFGLALCGCHLIPSSFPETIPIHHRRAGEGQLLAGAAKVDITPEDSVFMGGYNFWRKSEGVHDPLYVRVLVFQKGDFRLGLVAVDVVGIQRQDVLDLKFGLEGFDPRNVLICSTHNHSGPDTLGIWGLPPVYSGKSSSYMKRLRQAIHQALYSALENLAPAEMAADSVRANPKGIMKNLRRPGMVDSEIPVLHVRRAGGGETIATLVEVGCHPEVLPRTNYQITADYPGVVIAGIEKELGGIGIYVSGALGGLVTPDITDDPDDNPESYWKERDRVGNRVGELAVEVAREMKNYDSSPVLDVWHSSLFVRNSNFWYKLTRLTGIINRKLFSGGYVETEVNLWIIGNLRIASVPGEITPDVGLRIKKVVGGRPTMLIGLANDELGYLMPEAEFDLGIYSYERKLSPNRAAADAILRMFEDFMLLRGND